MPSLMRCMSRMGSTWVPMLFRRPVINAGKTNRQADRDVVEERESQRLAECNQIKGQALKKDSGRLYRTWFVDWVGDEILPELCVILLFGKFYGFVHIHQLLHNHLQGPSTVSHPAWKYHNRIIFAILTRLNSTKRSLIDTHWEGKRSPLQSSSADTPPKPGKKRGGDTRSSRLKKNHDDLKEWRVKIIPFPVGSACCPSGKVKDLVGQIQRRGQSASHGISGLCGDLVWTVYADTLRGKQWVKLVLNQNFSYQ